MRKYKALIAAAMVAMMLLLLSGCGASSLIQGSWMDDSQSMSMELGAKGKASVTAYGFPLQIEYTYENDTLTLIYSDTITDTGTITFYGDDEFIWEKTNNDGETYWETYYRQ